VQLEQLELVEQPELVEESQQRVLQLLVPQLVALQQRVPQLEVEESQQQE
jgi:hypothetical protein